MLICSSCLFLTHQLPVAVGSTCLTWQYGSTRTAPDRTRPRPRHPYLAPRLASRPQVAQFTPAQLAEAAAAAAEVGLWDPDLWGALRKASVARAPAFRPQPLAVLVAAVALMQVRRAGGSEVAGAAAQRAVPGMSEIVV